MEQLLEDTNDDFREYRLAYIKEVIETVMYENDDVAKKIHQSINTRKCSNSLCAKEFESMKRKYDICDSKVVTKQPSDKLVQPGNFPFKKNLNIGQTLNKNVYN